MARGSWPEGLTDSLWIDRIKAEEQYEILPLMGIDFQPEFLWAFLFGCALVFVVSWRNLRAGNAYAVTSGYKIINDLSIGELGGENALTRACFLYAGAISVIYIALTFFGKLIFQALNSVSTVGVHVDLAPYKFDSPQWPLLIAFGFAGLAPMLPPVKLAEGWLRRRTYRAVGIPVRIEQSARKILELLHLHSRLAEGVNHGIPVPKDQDHQRELVERLAASQREFTEKLHNTWLEHALKMREVRYQQVLRNYAELDLMIDWAKAMRGAWPGAEVNEPLRARERKLVQECEERLDEILMRIKAYSALADNANAPALVQNPPSPTSSASVGSGQAGHDESADIPHRLSWLKKAVAQMATDRDNLVAILAIYTEKDPDIGRATTPGTAHGDSLKEPMLKWLLDRSVVESAGKGPDFGVFVLLLVAFPLYTFLMAYGWHEITYPSADRSSPAVVLVSAGIETLRLAALVSFPILATFALRQSGIDSGEWGRVAVPKRRIYLRQLSVAAIIAGAVAMIGLYGVSILVSFVASDSPERFRDLLSDMKLPIAGFYLAMAPVAVVIVVAGLVGADRRRAGESAISVGVAAAICVMIYQYYHLRYFYGEKFFCPDGSPDFRLTDLMARECFLHYNAADLLIYPVSAFLLASVFGQTMDVSPDKAPKAEKSHGIAETLLIAGLMFFLLAQSVLSETLRVGFREDAEPFSFRPNAAVGKDDRPYRGFLATLCYDALEQRYDIISKPVTLQNRFELLRTSGDDAIDVLCDPVTLRLNQNDRLQGTLFSPIIFASGVTYLEEEEPGSDTVLITYGQNSTAARLALAFCRKDMNLSARQEHRKSLSIFCDTAEAILYFGEKGDVVPTFCRIAAITDNISCLEHAVKAELSQATLDKTARENSGHVPHGLRERLQKRVNAWTSITRSLKEFRNNPGNVSLRTEIIQQLGGNCDSSVKKKNGIIAPYRFCPLTSHDEMITWFCNQTGRKEFDLVYLGDREIIIAKHRSYQRMIQECPVKNADGGPDLSYEPYVLLVRQDRSEVFQFLQLRIHELFSDSRWATANYHASFGERRMSQALAYLFLLNGVDPPDGYMNTDPLKNNASD